MIPIPLRTVQQMKQFAPYTLSDEDKRLDAAEIYALYRTGDIRFLYPDSATKLITYFYKDTPFTTIFDKIAKDIHDRTKNPVYKIDVEPKRLFLSSYDPSTSALQDIHPTDKIDLDRDTYIMIQTDEGSFGHFCGAFYKHRQNKMFVFDSMMYMDHKKNVQSGYFKSFKKAIKDVFVVDRISFICDYYLPSSSSKKNNMMSSYSCEITGGSYNLCNMYLCSIDPPRQFFYDSYIMGTDNQNQYCWMWMLLYLLCKSIGGVYEWQHLHRSIVTHDIIPVVLIKYFISLTLKVDFPETLYKSPFFKKYLNTVVSNAANYRETFDDTNNHFRLMTCNLGSDLLQNDTKIANYKQCVELLFRNVSHILLESLPVHQSQTNTLVNKVTGYIKQNRPLYRKIKSFVEQSSEQQCKDYFAEAKSFVANDKIHIPADKLL